MPYADKEKQKTYQRERARNLRLAWLTQNGPCVKCGSFDNLEVDHIDPSTKKHHSIWSWSVIRRAEELAKCQVLCRSCHKLKTLAQLSKPMIHGTVNGYDRKKCRCADCRSAANDKSNEYRWRTGRRKKRVSHLSPL